MEITVWCGSVAVEPLGGNVVEVTMQELDLAELVAGIDDYELLKEMDRDTIVQYIKDYPEEVKANG